jgi:hypothetical protein
VALVRERVHPDQHAVQPEQLLADLGRGLLAIDGRLAGDALPGQGFDDRARTAFEVTQSIGATCAADSEMWAGRCKRVAAAGQGLVRVAFALDVVQPTNIALPFPQGGHPHSSDCGVTGPTSRCLQGLRWRGQIGVTTEPFEEYSRIVERAIALARTGQFASPEAVRRQLNREGSSSASRWMRERALNSEIRALCSATNPSGQAGRSFSGRRS